jgi:hypothetical protein
MRGASTSERRLEQDVALRPLPRRARGQALGTNPPARRNVGRGPPSTHDGRAGVRDVTRPATRDGRGHTRGIRATTPPVITGPRSTRAKRLAIATEHLRRPPQACSTKRFTSWRVALSMIVSWKGSDLRSWTDARRRRRSHPVAASPMSGIMRNRAPVAQLDRAPDFESVGRRFESCRARHLAVRDGRSRRSPDLARRRQGVVATSASPAGRAISLCSRAVSLRSRWIVRERRLASHPTAHLVCFRTLP